jgi:hypothetical protein
MSTQHREYRGFAGLRGGLPWWGYVLMVLGFYLLGWALHQLGLVPGQ